MKQLSLLFLAAVLAGPASAQSFTTLHLAKGDSVTEALVRVGCNPLQIAKVLGDNNFSSAYINSVPAAIDLRVEMGCEQPVPQDVAEASAKILGVIPSTAPTPAKRSGGTLLDVLIGVIVALIVALIVLWERRGLPARRVKLDDGNEVCFQPAYVCPAGCKESDADLQSMRAHYEQEHVSRHTERIR